MKEIKPFEIKISDQQINDLNTRLSLTRYPEKETVEDWSQGIPLAYVQEVAEYWKNEYNWRDREKRLNQFSQFTCEIMGLNIHFIHVKSKEASARPLIITHGWPGSIVEFQKVIAALTDPVAHGGKAEDAFHVVCPSLPGYGFSDKPTTAGWGADKIAEAWSELMQALGYSRYFAQGGDWGAIVTTYIGLQDAEHCGAIHLNMPMVPPDPDTMDNLTEQEQKALEDMGRYDAEDAGYSKQQSTRPQTIGYGLVDSPVGQMAWILEKYWRWMDCNGHPENVLSKDELLDNVMMYWWPATGASSGRLYWESFDNPPMEPVKVPIGCSIYPKEIFRSSKRWAAKHFGDKLFYWNELDQGGHFAAFERPEIYVQELRQCFANAEL